MAITFEEARTIILREAASLPLPAAESRPLIEAAGRVLAEPVLADRDYPPVARSMRDGFAVRYQDLPGRLQVMGEIRAGEQWAGAPLEPGQAIEIMTGAPVPAGANAVIMVEHVSRDGVWMQTETQARDSENINPVGKEAARGAVLAHPGRRLNYADIALLATVGHTQVGVYRKPTVAILATGDEVVTIDSAAPESYQVRNSNSYSIAAQVDRAGGLPVILPVAVDRYDETRALMEAGLQHDLLLLSGGVSAGKYDIVEKVLADLGAEFYFDRVKIQPGAPLVFGKARGRFFFGLPGNPASTMVTFEVLARAMVERLSGVPNPALPVSWARLTRPFHHKGGLRRFLPARLEDGGLLTPVGWAGSSDLAALGRANAFLIAEPDKQEYTEGDWIQVLPQ